MEEAAGTVCENILALTTLNVDKADKAKSKDKG